ncbi:ice-binding family protein [Streptomyces sp. NBC_00199]|uniref:ice-binding family protein n=1 Tax=Streptomyces sp. NBC_00199 TaxID=2975678 RepID=UPI0022568D57|nr:ice-binding family protein [Streptomyces sp. NBC_00199]MCX5266400.1 ice-binding family protein [Streptomyces sp. NBC_00199]
MKLKIPQAADRRSLSGVLASALAATIAVVLVALTPIQALAIATPVPLATAASFSVLAGQGVTNTGPTLISHDVGTHPNPSITGLLPTQVLGAVHAADAVALQAKSDLVTAYDNAAGQATNFALSSAIGNGQTLLPGVHTAVSGVGLNGDLILDAAGNPNAVWVFQIPEALTTATSSRVLLTNGASACNVFWQVGSSATLGTTSTFVGTIMALTSITVTTGTNIEGRALARNGSVTLDNNRIFLGGCATSTTGGTTTGTTTGTTAGTTTGTTAGTTTGTTTGTTAGTSTSGGLLGGGLVSGGLVSGGLLGGPIVGTGGTSGNVAGNTSGNTAGNSSGNTAGNTAGNTGNTAGNTAGNTTGGHGAGGHDHAPGGPDHEGKPGGPDHGTDDQGQNDHGKDDHGKDDHGKDDHGKDDHGQSGHDKQPDENYGYDGVPKGYEGDDHSKGHESYEG